MSEIPFDDINYLNIFPYVGHTARIEILNVEAAGGQVPVGSYTFAVRYLDNFSTPTNFFATSPQVAIPTTGPGQSAGRLIGSPGETASTRSIRYGLFNLDMTYDRVQVAVIPQYNGVPGTPVLLPPQPILASDMFFTYTGTEAVTESSLDEIVINTASYRRAKTMTQVEGSLYMGNMTRYQPINYQQFANNIRVKVELDDTPGGFLITASFARSLSTGPGDVASPQKLAYRSKGFKRGDVYALYVSFILNDGHETPAYHIPGREATTFEYKGQTYQENAVLPESEETLRQIAGLDGQGQTLGRWFQFISKPHPELNTGYWENRDEQYPFSEDWEVWDVDANGDPVFTGKSLAGQNVRHHHIPDNEYIPFRETIDGVNTLRVAGLKLENVKLPAEIRDRVRSMRVHFARREPQNQKILDQSFLLSTDIDTVGSGQGSVTIVTGNPTNKDVPPRSGSMTGTLCPFNILRQKQNIQGITHLRAVAQNPNVQDYSFTSIFGGSSNQRTVSEEAILHNDFQGFSDDDRFKRVVAVSYVPSYTFQEDDDGNALSNSLVRLSTGLFPFDFDNTNGEEKIAVQITAPGATLDNFPDIQYELCQYKENMYLGFDLQELTFTGFQDNDLDKYDPRTYFDEEDSPSPSPDYPDGAFESDIILGGDTFIGIWSSRHTRWLDEGDVVEQYVRHSMVESYAHPELRSPGEFIWEQWWPGTAGVREYASIIFKDSRPNFFTKEGEVFPDNVIHYNQDFQMRETYKPAFPFPKRRSQVVHLPTRIIRSRQEEISLDIDLFRQFREEDFLDLPTNRGELVRLSNLNNLLIPHMRRSIYRTRGKEELATGDFRAFLGTGDIFEIKPDELYETDVGHGGLQGLRHGAVTEYGYFFVDQQARKVFHLTPEGLRELSAEGMERFFVEKLTFNFESYGFRNYLGISDFFGIEVSWDPVYKRYLLTKKDIKFKDKFEFGDEGSPSPSPVEAEDLEFDEARQQFLDPFIEDEVLEWDDDRFFEPDSFTISYSPQTESWISFHDYFPSMYFFNSSRLYSSIASTMFLHNRKDTRSRFYGTAHPSSLTYIDNRDAKTSKTVAGLFIETELKNPQGQPVRDKTVTKIRVWNSYQDTGDIEVEFFKDSGNARQAQGFWRVNQLRNMKDAEGEVLSEREWYNKEFLSDRYHYVKLEYNNLDNNVLDILSSELNIKESLR